MAYFTIAYPNVIIESGSLKDCQEAFKDCYQECQIVKQVGKDLIVVDTKKSVPLRVTATNKE